MASRAGHKAAILTWKGALAHVGSDSPIELIETYDPEGSPRYRLVLFICFQIVGSCPRLSPGNHHSSRLAYLTWVSSRSLNYASCSFKIPMICSSEKVAALHALVLVLGQSELQTGLSPWGKVKFSNSTRAALQAIFQNVVHLGSCWEAGIPSASPLPPRTETNPEPLRRMPRLKDSHREIERTITSLPVT
jgi:hypothetical protein